jgi:thioredoxin-like negative regulator of GroEL
MISRLLLTVLIISLGILAYQVFNWRLLRRASQKPLEMKEFNSKLPTVLYFTMPGCVPCQTVQQPALARLQVEVGTNVQVIQVDVTKHPNLAQYWEVLSVPTTFIIDSKGEPRKVNHGVVVMDKLLAQLEAVEGRSLQKTIKKEYNEFNTLEN